MVEKTKNICFILRSVRFLMALLDILSVSSSYQYVTLCLGDVSTRGKVLLVVALLFGSVGGLIVAAILKKLDNIVKEYSGATANMFTAVICSFMFPEKFSFTIYIFLAMVLLFGGIYLYETQKVTSLR